MLRVVKYVRSKYSFTTANVFKKAVKPLLFFKALLQHQLFIFYGRTLTRDQNSPLRNSKPGLFGASIELLDHHLIQKSQAFSFSASLSQILQNANPDFFLSTFPIIKVFLPLEHDFDLCFYRCEFYTYCFTVIFGIQIIKLRLSSTLDINVVFTPCSSLCCLQPQQHIKLSHAMQYLSISWGCYDPRPTFQMSPASKLSCRAIKTKH